MKKVFLFLVLLLFLFSMVITAQETAEDDSKCKNCHPAAAKELQQGAMQFLSCNACHGKGHTGPGTGTFEPGKAEIKSCIPCHKNEYEKYKSGKHYEAWPALTAVVAYNTLFPKKASVVGCVACHKIGQVWDDGTRGRCDYCHTRHVFSKAEARKPEACRMCHAGDQPQYEAWANSMHGSVYEQSGGDVERGPTCVTCHGGHDVITAWGFLGLRGESGDEDAEWKDARNLIKEALDVIGLSKSPQAIHSYEEWQKLRAKMIERCQNCHVKSFVRSEMKKNDDFLRELDLSEAVIIKTINSLYDAKHIHDKTRMELYYKTIIIRIGAFIGAYHSAPSLAWDHGYFKLFPGSFIARKVDEIHKKLSRAEVVIISIIVVVLLAIIVCFIILFIRRKRS